MRNTGAPSTLISGPDGSSSPSSSLHSCLFPLLAHWISPAFAFILPLKRQVLLPSAKLLHLHAYLHLWPGDGKQSATRRDEKQRAPASCKNGHLITRRSFYSEGTGSWLFALFARDIPPWPDLLSCLVLSWCYFTLRTPHNYSLLHDSVPAPFSCSLA